MPGQRQKYEVTHDGKQIPSFRADILHDNNLNSYQRTFHHNVNPSEAGPYVSSNQINFHQNVNQITVTPGHPVYEGTSFLSWTGENTLLQISKNGVLQYTSPGNSIGWYSHGYLPSNNMLDNPFQILPPIPMIPCQ